MPRLHELADKRSASLRGCNLSIMAIPTTITNKGQLNRGVALMATHGAGK
jgi:hypothetical protein